MKSSRLLPSLCLALSMAVCAGHAQMAGAPSVAGGVAAILAQPQGTPLNGLPIQRAALAGMYGPRNNQPIWLDASGNPNLAAAAALAMISGAGSDGLNPDAYNLNAIEALAKPATPEESAALEVLLSSGVADYLHDMATGRTPIGPMRDDTFADTADRAALLNAAAQTSPAQLAAYAAALAPASPDYAVLRKALADLRAAKDAGGWQAIGDGPSLKPGMHDAVMPALRVRLKQPPVTGKQANLYDPQLAGAVRAFQETHAIKDDATLGKDTRAALNMSVDGRIAEVIAAMERWRWLPHDLGPRYIMVDVGGYWARYVDNGQVALQNAVIVGREERETPLLQSEVQNVVINPTWTLPPTIIKKDILPKLAANPDYLEERGIKLYRRTDDGLREVHGATYSRGSDYVLRQPPGKENPLGQYKLLFPNKYSIYLHDTDEHKKFSAALRNFSSGCVRVQDVRQFVDALLAGQLTGDKIDEYLNTGDTKTIRLARPLPIYINYFSVWTDSAGNLIFGPDLYDKDVALAEQIQAPPATIR